MYIRRIISNSENPGCQEMCHVIGTEGGFGIEKNPEGTYIAHLDNSKMQSTIYRYFIILSAVDKDSFVCLGYFVQLENFSLIWIRHYCR